MVFVTQNFNPSYEFFDPAFNTHIKDILQQFPDNSIWLQLGTLTGNIW
jgi:hypothetical protein